MSLLLVSVKVKGRHPLTTTCGCTSLRLWYSPTGAAKRPSSSVCPAWWRPHMELRFCLALKATTQRCEAAKACAHKTICCGKNCRPVATSVIPPLLVPLFAFVAAAAQHCSLRLSPPLCPDGARGSVSWHPGQSNHPTHGTSFGCRRSAGRQWLCCDNLQRRHAPAFVRRPGMRR